MADCLAAIGTQYQLVRTKHTLNGPGSFRLCSSNPKRWAVYVTSAVGGLFYLDSVDDPVTHGGFPINQTTVVEFKFRDHPALTTGEIWALVGAAVVSVTTYEEIFIG